VRGFRRRSENNGQRIADNIPSSPGRPVVGHPAQDFYIFPAFAGRFRARDCQSAIRYREDHYYPVAHGHVRAGDPADDCSASYRFLKTQAFAQKASASCVPNAGRAKPVPIYTPAAPLRTTRNLWGETMRFLAPCNGTPKSTFTSAFSRTSGIAKQKKRQPIASGQGIYRVFQGLGGR
jgi:hypothetical protein